MSACSSVALYEDGGASPVFVSDEGGYVLAGDERSWQLDLAPPEGRRVADGQGRDQPWRARGDRSTSAVRRWAALLLAALWSGAEAASGRVPWPPAPMTARATAIRWPLWAAGGASHGDARRRRTDAALALRGSAGSARRIPSPHPCPRWRLALAGHRLPRARPHHRHRPRPRPKLHLTSCRRIPPADLVARDRAGPGAALAGHRRGRGRPRGRSRWTAARWSR